MIKINKFKVASVYLIFSFFNFAQASSCLDLLNEGHPSQRAYHCQATKPSLVQNSLRSLSLCLGVVEKDATWAHAELKWAFQDEQSTPWIYKTQYSEKFHQTHYLPPSSLPGGSYQESQSELFYFVRSEGSYWQEILDVQRSFHLNKSSGQARLQVDLKDRGLLWPGLWQNWIDVDLTCTQIR